MQIGITGATGFLGRYIVNQLAQAGHACRCWRRSESDTGGFDGHERQIEWVGGDLHEPAGFAAYCKGLDALVHSALYRPRGSGFRAAGQDHFEEFVRVNVMGTLQLMSTAQQAGVGRFVFISTCAVHEVILPDRKLDEAHPLWATNHYGAHKAAIEKFVHSFGLGDGWPICALRPTGIYGAARPIERSRWFDIVRRVARGEDYASNRGGKEVHAADVAKAVGILLDAPADAIRGQAFNCYDQYIAEKTVAQMAAEISGSRTRIGGENAGPKNQIDTGKIRALGMSFGGEPLLRRTVEELLGSLGA